jgi:acyl carrier protein
MGTNVESEVAAIFRDVFDVDDLGSLDSWSIETQDDWDSLIHIALVVAIEQEFEIKFAMEEIPKMISFGAIMEMVFEKVGHG